MNRRAVLIGPLLVGPLLALAAVQAGGQPENQLQSVEPRMVDVTVVAVDSKGLPVTDLKREELTVADNGKRQDIAFFRHRDDSSTHVSDLAFDEASNRAAENVPRATVILFDLLNERFGTRGAAASRLAHDLLPLESADNLYLYCLTLDGAVFPVRPLPGAEGQARELGGKPWTRDIKSVLDRALRATLQVRPVDDDDPNYRVMLTYRALDAIAAELQRVPGRKSLVWVTDGIPIELSPDHSDTGTYVDFTPQLRELSDVFDRSAVSIYPARQVMLGSPNGMGGPGTTGLGSIDTLDEFAELTGGRADAGKDIGAAVRQAISDTRTYYRVGFYPHAGAWDGKFHKLKIGCSRKGVKIQAKSGYYAEAAGTRTQEAIDTAFGARFDAAEIGLRGRVKRSADGKTARLEVRIDARDIAMTEQGGQYLADLRFAIGGYSFDGPPARVNVVARNLRLTAAERDLALKDGLPYSQDVALAPGMGSLRLVVFDRSGDSVGTLTLSLQP